MPAEIAAKWKAYTNSLHPGSQTNCHHAAAVCPFPLEISIYEVRPKSAVLIIYEVYEEMSFPHIA